MRLCVWFKTYISTYRLFDLEGRGFTGCGGGGVGSGVGSGGGGGVGSSGGGGVCSSVGSGGVCSSVGSGGGGGIPLDSILAPLPRPYFFFDSDVCLTFL